MRRSANITSFFDIGTNAARMTTVKFDAKDAYQVLADKRIPTRLGENSSGNGPLSPQAIRRTVKACRRLVRFSKKTGARQIIAVATSAAREASNRNLFLKTLERGAGIKPVVLPAQKEARLIYNAATTSANIRTQRVLVLEIGGGTTELALGHGRQCKSIKILKLGAVRMKSLYPAIASRKVISEPVYQEIVEELKKLTRKQLNNLTGRPFDIVIGSAGTILNLADIAGRVFRGRRLAAGDVVSFKQIQTIIRCLCKLPLAKRKKVPGINPDRADIIIGGAAILEAIMTLLKIRSIRASFSGLREGLIQEYMRRDASRNE